MSYYVTKTDGTSILVLDGTKDTTSTSLTLIGKLSQTYGEDQNENFLHLLENFALGSAPAHPIKGQLWFDTSTNSIKAYRTDGTWREVGSNISGNVYLDSNIFIGSNTIHIVNESGNVRVINNANNKNINIQANVSGNLISALGINGTTGLVTVAAAPTANLGVATKNYVDTNVTTLESNINTTIAAINANIGSLSTTLSNTTSNLSSLTTNITSGTGNVDAQAIKLSGNVVLSSSGAGNAIVNLKTPGGVTILSAYGTNSSATPVTINGQWVLGVGATINASYADLAEYYSSDSDYEPGTVVVFGGEKEITVTNINNDTRVAGVITTNPAYRMNTDLVGQRICLTLQGRTPCKVIGPVKKGDLLTTSTHTGCAEVTKNPMIGSILGKSLEDNDVSGLCIVEVAVSRS